MLHTTGLRGRGLACLLVLARLCGEGTAREQARSGLLSPVTCSAVDGTSVGVPWVPSAHLDLGIQPQQFAPLMGLRTDSSS